MRRRRIGTSGTASLVALAAVALASAGTAAGRLHDRMSAADARGQPTGVAGAERVLASEATSVITRFQARANTPDHLEAVRLRLRTRDARSPAYQVDEWIIRISTTPHLREAVEDALGRMQRYEPMIRETLRQQRMPEELLYVVVVESEFKENAVSPAGAAGMWQFMPATGRRYDLEVSEWVDERRDPVKSTRAAVLHLRDLHSEFASWHLALAAYNGGAGRVGRTLQRNAGGRRGDEQLYWVIRPHLPGETQRYVPKYLAIVEIARRPEAFGLRPRPKHPSLAFDIVWTPGNTPVDSVARAVRASTAAVRALNPHLIRGVTPPGRRWPVRVPPRTSHPTESK